MASITFDTLKFARRLKEAGVPERHAEAEADALAEIFNANLGELATKRDLNELGAATKRDLNELETANKRDLKELELKINGELKLVKWMLGLLLAGVLSLVLKAFFIP